MMNKANSDGDAFRQIADIDRVVHEPARLMILLFLYALESSDFLFLMNATELTWGNLSSHLTKLEEAGYVQIEKTYDGRKPRTLVRMTPDGRKAMKKYRDTIDLALSNTV
ncbi:MAG: winged helix-turn-helix domain-containing protein [Anaerolineales bacterium]